MLPIEKIEEIKNKLDQIFDGNLSNSVFDVLKELDVAFVPTSKLKYKENKSVINSLKNLRIPQIIEDDRITLLALSDYFQKKYVYKQFNLHIQHDSFQDKLPWDIIKLSIKANNFPHLLGIKSERDIHGNILSRTRPKEFLDGVFYQWILINNLDGVVLDDEKLETLP